MASDKEQGKVIGSGRVLLGKEMRASIELSRRLEGKEMHETPRQCTLCDDDIALHHCQTCSEQLCDICYKAHKRQKKNHTMVSIGTGGKPKTIKCFRHSTNNIAYFCQSCADIACTECIQGEHKSHTFQPIDKSKQELKDLCQDLAKQLRIPYDDIMRKREGVKQLKTDHVVQCQDIKKALNTRHSKLDNVVGTVFKDTTAVINKDETEIQQLCVDADKSVDIYKSKYKQTLQSIGHVVLSDDLNTIMQFIQNTQLQEAESYEVQEQLEELSKRRPLDISKEDDWLQIASDITKEYLGVPRRAASKENQRHKILAKYMEPVLKEITDECSKVKHENASLKAQLDSERTRFIHEKMKIKAECSKVKTENVSLIAQLDSETTRFTQEKMDILKGSCCSSVINGMEVLTLPSMTVYEDRKAKLRHCKIGYVNTKYEQKTILMVGGTGSGKSTLIDGFCNYIFATKLNDGHRFQLIDPYSNKDTLPQTEWITIHTMTPDVFNSNMQPYTLNLIDTPGFGDIRRDQMVVDQIKALFEQLGKHGIDSIDAICLVVKAPDARLTSSQKYIFDSILAVFGQNIGENIVVMVTFADGSQPPVIDSIKQAKVPYRKTFQFNNNAFSDSTFTNIFWKFGEESFKTFFGFLNELSAKSLNLTREVLELRHILKDSLDNVEECVQQGIAAKRELEREEAIFADNKQEQVDNKNFEYTATQFYSEKINCPPGRYVLHCMHCHNVCHDDCEYPDDDSKVKCKVIDKQTGNCTRCKNKCHWTNHKNTGYKIVHKSREVTETYQAASESVEDTLKIIEITKQKYEQHRKTVEFFAKLCRETLQRLRYIALKPDALSEVKYVEMLIKGEINNHNAGWEVRVQELTDIKSRAQRIEAINADKPLLPILEPTVLLE